MYACVRVSSRGMGGLDIRTELRLSFMEAVNGCQRDVTVTYVTAAEGGRPARKTKTVSVDVPPGQIDRQTAKRLQAGRRDGGWVGLPPS